MDGKQFAVAMLLAIALLTVAFIPLAHQQGGGSYDPWLDYNEDGKIDVNELSPLGQAYGTSGDPTKNVTIVGHATKVIRVVTSVGVPASGSWVSDFVSIDGYSKVTVLIYMTTNQNVYYLRATDNDGTYRWTADTVNNFNGYVVKTYDVMNQGIIFMIYNNSPSVAYLTVEVYLMA